MAVATDKIRISVYLEPGLKPKLEALAKQDKRSLSNFIEMLCEKEVQRREEEPGRK